ncbi:hypothetical protein ACFL59_08310 [Planctomycetota bacterium]
MDAREIQILRHFEAGLERVKPLLRRYPRSSVYRLLGKLVDQGLLRREGRRYSLMPAGRDALDSLGTGNVQSGWTLTLEAQLPHLRHTPTPLHRAVLELVACAIVARRHRLRTSHHPAFLLFAPKLRWKTWLAKAGGHMAGGDPTYDVIYLGSESGRSMLSRKGARGQRVTVRSALGKSVVGLDEYLRAKPDVRRLVQVYLFGELSVPDENETLTIEAVPIVTLNPREDAADLDQRLGLDEAMLRRSVPVDLTAIDIPPALLTEGEILLERMKALGAADFPPPQHPDREPRAEVKKLLLATLDCPERLAGIDVTMLAMLATAATAWLEPEQALSLVVSNYLTIVRQLGWTKPGWKDTLASANAKPATVESPPAVPDVDPNPLDYDAKIHALADMCSRLDLSPTDAVEELQHLVELRRLGFTAEIGATTRGGKRHAVLIPERGHPHRAEFPISD